MVTLGKLWCGYDRIVLIDGDCGSSNNNNKEVMVVLIMVTKLWRYIYITVVMIGEL